MITRNRVTDRTVAERFVGWASSKLESRTSRRGFLAGTALVGSALATRPLWYALHPVTASDAVCGTQTQCSEGFTVMCCTITGGKNSCPPGTFAAGWWKADNASYCCGGPRYYIDCNSTCSGGCAGTGHFCSPDRWSCTCGCGNPSTCDQRRVCCNVFRYGQCHQEIPCSGPVVCRVITCIPPWQWDSTCTTASATDNVTLSHSAPCLTPDCPSPVITKYYALGGEASVLGTLIQSERNTPVGGGRFVVCRGGVIYWTAGTGAFEVHGPIRTAWEAAGGAGGYLGFPLSDVVETGVPGNPGQVSAFQGGGIWSTNSTGAHLVPNGPIRDRWIAAGGQNGALGFPLTDVYADALGHQRCDFQGGSLLA